MMNSSTKIMAALAYVPLIGWLLAWAQRKNAFVQLHLRQSLALVLFLIGVVAGWLVVGWLLAWLPHGVILTAALFALVIAAVFFAAFALVLGVLNAVRGKASLLPIFGKWLVTA